MKKSSILKKLVYVFGGLLGLLVVAAIVIPLVVDVDKYRPQIVQAANEKINGKIELGKLGLSLWGRVKVDIDGLKVSDAQGRPVVEVKDAGLNLPLLSILSGRPELRVVLNNPVINVVKQKNGKLNAMALMKETPAADSSPSGAPTTSGSATPTKDGGSTEIPGIVLNSKLTFLIQHAKLAYKDEITGDAYKVDDLNVKLQDVSPSSTIPFEITANLDLAMKNGAKVTGPVVLEGSAKAISSGSSFEKADLTASLKLDGAEIVYPGSFQKAKGTALGADLAGTVGKDQFAFPTLKLRLADVVIDGSTSGKTSPESTTIDFKAQSNQIDVAKLGALSPLVKQYDLNGIVELKVRASGPTDKLDYGSDIKFNKVSLNHESMKQSLEVNGALSVATNEIKNLLVNLSAKDFDVKLSGSMQNFMAPRFKFNLASNVMDLDGLLKASEKAAEARKEQAKSQTQAAESKGSSGQAAAAPVVDYNAMFKPLRENAIAAAAAGTFDFSINRMKSTGVVIDGIKGQLALNNLLLSLRDFSMRIFEGSIKGGMSFNAKPVKPEVGTNLVVTGLKTQKMVESQMPFARNTVKGVISANLNIGGPGLNQADIVSAWKGNGVLEIQEAVFSTLDIGRQIRDGVIAKLPDIAKSKVKVSDALLNWKGEYEHVRMKYALASGRFNINEISGKAHPNKGMDLKGNGAVQLKDYALELNLDLIDTYNMTGGSEIARDKRYGHFTLSPRVTGTLFSPKFDWGSTMSKLAQSAAETKGKQALQKALGDKLPGGLGKIIGGGNKDSGGNGSQQPAQKPADQVKGVLKGFFGR
ncbi:MAG: AsmA family protein [Bdellovibrionota bacterium]